MENFNKNSALIDIDLSGLIKKYLKNWYLFAISIIACGVITFAYVKIKKDIYLIKADILISDENSGGGSMQSAMLKSFSFGNLVEVEAKSMTKSTWYRHIPPCEKW